MKFIFVLHDAELYGASYAALDFATGLKKLGHECIFVLPDGGPFAQVLSVNGYEHYVLPYQNWAVFRPTLYQNKYVSKNRLTRFIRLFQFTREQFLIARELKRKIGPVDWVITNNALVSFGFVLAQTLKSRHVWQFREFVGEGTGYAYIFSPFVRRFIYNRPAKFIFSTQVLKNFYAGDTGNKGQVLREPHAFIPPANPNGPNTIRPIRTFGMLGSINQNKGQLEMTVFFQNLFPKYPNIQLIIAGSGETEPIKNFIAETQLEKNIVLIDHMDKYDFFDNVDCVIVNSKFEGFGRVAIEAMKSRKLLLGRKSTGTYELIGENERGLLFESEKEFLHLIDNLMAGNLNVPALINTAQVWAETNTEPVGAVSRILKYLETQD